MSIYKSKILQNQLAISQLDPLNFNMYVKEIHELNDKGQTKKLTGLYCETIKKAQNLKNEWQYKLAAMRDIGILMGSLARWDIDPIKIYPASSELLEYLGRSTNFPPRDTLIHYTLLNPEGKFTRSFTGLAEELYLIKSARIGLNDLILAIFLLNKLFNVNPQSPEFYRYCLSIQKYLENSLIKGIVLAVKNIHPSIFAQKLRPFYKEIEVDGKQYFGVSAITIPAFVFDHLLWSSQLKDDFMDSVKKTYLPYIDPEVRKLFIAFGNNEDLISRFIRLCQSQKKDPQIKCNYLALRKIISLLIKFRGPHIHLAKKSYSSEVKPSYKHGSGGVSFKMLDIFLDYTRTTRCKLDKVFRE